MVRKHRGDDCLQGRSLCLPWGWTPFHVLCWSGNNTSELCLILRSHRLYFPVKLQPILYINCSVYYCYLLCFPSSPIHWERTLPLSCSPTHTLCTHTPHATPYSWKVYANYSCWRIYFMDYADASSQPWWWNYMLKVFSMGNIRAQTYQHWHQRSSGHEVRLLHCLTSSLSQPKSCT